MHNALQQPIKPHDTFDYSCIGDRDLRLAAVDAAANVRHGLSHQAELIIEVGTILIDAKENLIPHGFFNDWLRIELAMSPRTAQQYMSVARNFGSKPATVAHLMPTTLYKLSEARNEAARLEVIQRLQAGEQLDDASVREIANAMKPQAKLEASIQAPTGATPTNADPGRPADANALYVDQHPSAYSELTTFLAPRCFGEFEHLISLVRKAGCNDLAAYMQWHHDAVMKDVTQLLLSVSNSTIEEPGLFHPMRDDALVRNRAAHTHSSLEGSHGQALSLTIEA